MRWRGGGMLVLAAAMLAVGEAMAAGPTTQPYEAASWATPESALDKLIFAGIRARGLPPANPCSDEVFIRRVHLDVIGTLPEAGRVGAFLKDRRSDKRAALVEELLARKEFADYWAMKWCDVLRVKAEFPINLWPNAAQAYHRWVHDCLRSNMAYDRFAGELLTAGGSNFRVPQVNFYRAIQGREPPAIAQAVALTLMGTRIEGWPEERRAQMALFFSRIAYKPTGEWKEEIVCLDPAPAGPLDAVLPDGTRVHIDAGADPRAVFAKWLTAKENPWLAKAAVNRVWAWLLGRGLVHEADDIRPDNPPVHPEALALLERELAQSGFDLKHIYRLILNSRVYQQSSIAARDPAQAEALFACYPVRQLDAEVLIDALCMLFESRESYSSPVPEPFTFIPENTRTIDLPDASISSSFLELFGRPARDSGLMSERNTQPAEGQRLHLLNSTHIQNKIERSGRLRGWMLSAKADRAALAKQVYLHVLSRQPTAAEIEYVKAHFRTPGLRPDQAAYDVVWALINSKEFLYRH